MSKYTDYIIRTTSEIERAKMGVALKIVYLRMKNLPIDERLLNFSKIVNEDNYEELSREIESIETP